MFSKVSRKVAGRPQEGYVREGYRSLRRRLGAGGYGESCGSLRNENATGCRKGCIGSRGRFRIQTFFTKKVGLHEEKRGEERRGEPREERRCYGEAIGNVSARVRAVCRKATEGIQEGYGKYREGYGNSTGRVRGGYGQEFECGVKFRGRLREDRTEVT